MRIIPQLRGSQQHKAGPCSHTVHGNPASHPCTWVSPLQLLIWKLGSVETSVCFLSCTYCHPDTRSPLLHKQPRVSLLLRNCLQSSGCSPCTCACCPATVCPQDREHCKDQTVQHWKSIGHYSKIPFRGQIYNTVLTSWWLPQTLAVPRFPQESMWEVLEMKSPHLRHGTCPSAGPCSAATQSNKFPCTKQQGKSLSCCMVQQKRHCPPADLSLEAEGHPGRMRQP